MVLSPLVAAAQTATQADALRKLNGQILTLHDHALREEAEAGGMVSPLLGQRLFQLAALIESDPHQALLAAFPPEVLRELAASFPGLTNRFETYGVWRGAVRIQVADGVRFSSSRSTTLMKADGGDLKIYFAGPPPAGLKSGSALTVRGLRAGNHVAVERAELVLPSSEMGCSTTGPQNIAVILVNLRSSFLPAEMNRDHLTGIMLGNDGGGAQHTPDWSVDDFWRQNSDNQTWIDETGAGRLAIVGPYNLPGDYSTNGSLDLESLRRAAYAAADPDLDYRNYSRALIVIPNNAAFSWAGMATVGCWGGECPGDSACNYSWAVQRADQMWSRSWGVMLTTHELGHTLNMIHSSTRSFEREPLGPPGLAGALVEYGDRFSTMGSWNFGFYNADAAIHQLGWLLPGTNYLDVTTSGAYSLRWYGERPSGLKALRIRRGTTGTSSLIVEMRRKQGLYDSQVSSQVWTGALVHYRDEQTGLYTHLLDFTKGTTSFDDFSDPALSAGQSWADPYSNLSITIDSIVNDTLNLTVTYGTTPCTRAAPTVTFTPANRGTHAAKPAAYTVTVKNNDSTSCSAATFTLDTTLPVGWPADAFTPAELTIDPQQSSTADFAKTPPASTAPGTYTIDATARHFSAPSLVGTGAASCTVMSRAVPLRANLVVPAVSYATGASIPITVTIRRGTAAVAGASVKYTLSRAGHQVATRTLVTGTNGQTKWFYSAAVRGDYSVSAWATKGTDSATSNYDTFTIN